MSDRRRSRRLVGFRLVTLAVGALAAVAAIAIGTPYLLLGTAKIKAGDWTLLGNVGQAYGGIAAVVSTLALAGVVASFALQSREFTASRETFARTTHAELLFRALDDSMLRECWGPSPHGNVDRDRQHIYSNLIVAYWRSMFEIGVITEDQLHELAADMFAGDAGRRYWTIAGPFQRRYYPSPRDRVFVEILSQEHGLAADRLAAPETIPEETNRPVDFAPETARSSPTTNTSGTKEAPTGS